MASDVIQVHSIPIQSGYNPVDPALKPRAPITIWYTGGAARRRLTNLRVRGLCFGLYDALLPFAPWCNRLEEGGGGGCADECVRKPVMSGVLCYFQAIKLRDSFIDIYKKGGVALSAEKLKEANIGWEDIFEEIPIVVHNSPLVSALMAQVHSPGRAYLPILGSKVKDGSSKADSFMCLHALSTSTATRRKLGFMN